MLHAYIQPRKTTDTGTAARQPQYLVWPMKALIVREIRFPELLVLMSSRTHAAQTHNNKNVLSLLHVPRRVATVLTPDPFCAAFRYQRRAKETERQSDRQGKTNSRVLIAPLGYQKPAQRRTSTLRHAQAAHQRNNNNTTSPSAVIRTVEACSAPPRPGLVVRRCASERTQQWVNYAGSHHHTTAAQKNKQNKQQRCKREKQKDRERQQGDGKPPTHHIRVHQYRRSNHGDAS